MTFRHCSQYNLLFQDSLYQQTPAMVIESDIKEENRNDWQVTLKQGLFNISSASGYFRDLEQLTESGLGLYGNQLAGENADEWVPVYEDWMIFQFDHRYNSHGSDYTTALEHQDPGFLPMPRYWIERDRTLEAAKGFPQQKWFIVFRDRARSTDMRTAIFSVIPFSGVTHPIPIIGSPLFNSPFACPALANFNSFVFDYVARQKLSGYHLTFYVLKQQSVISPHRYTPNLLTYIVPRVLELTYTAWDLQPFAQDCGYYGPPFRWDDERRFLLRCELDAAYFHLYGIAREDVDYIMETFPIVKRKDEVAHGEYRTKRVIMEIYDDMAEAMHTGQPYQTRLGPPPADPRLAHPWDPAFGPEPPEEQGIGSGELGIGEKLAPYSPLPTPHSPSLTPEPQTPEPLILRQPEPEIKKPKKPKPARAAQGTFMEVMPAPAGPYNVRLKRVMALGGDPSPLATRELVAFLADENSNIRWLAGSSLVQRAGGEAGADTVAAIVAFLTQAEPERVEQARSEALRVLGLIADTAEEESVRAAAGDALDKFRG